MDTLNRRDVQQHVTILGWLVVGILGLANFPLGTAIGLYTLWVFTQPAATEYFGAPTPA